MKKEMKIAMITIFLLLSMASINAVSAANTYTITDTTYSNYFNTTGYINDTNIVAGDVLDCSGAINNKNMYIDRALNITSTDKTAQILNGTITILPAGSGTNITNLVINNANQNGIIIDGADGNSITNNQITVHQNTASYGIQLIDADNNQITGNTITTTGDTITYGVYLAGSSSNVIESNTINTTGLAGDVDWSDYMDGSIYSTLGIFISNVSSSNTLTNNIITTDYNATSGSGYDTVAGVQIRKDCDGNNLSGNTINTTGYSYAYGLEVVGGDETESTENIVSNNNINTVGVSVHANGLKVGAYTENTLVSGNTITATAPDFAYGVYLENFTGFLRNVTITGNNVTATANINYVVELYVASGSNLDNGNKITNNVLTGVGNYSIGIATYGSRYNTISGNIISITGDNTATHIPNADAIPESNAGIKLYTSSRYNIVNSNIISGAIVTGSTSSSGIHLNKSTYNTLQDNTINNSFTNGLFLENASNNNTITSNDVSIDNVDEDDDSYGIHLSASNNNTITENNITTIGDGTGSAGNGKFTYGVYLEGSVDNALGTNVINTTGAAANVDWSTGNYPTIGVYLSEDSNSNDLSNNTVTTDYNTTGAGGYDTILGVRINKSDANNLTSNNIINTTGNSYAYGLEIVGSSDNTSTSNILSDNTISTVGNSVYANGVKVGIYTADSTVSGNTVSATAPDYAYALYLEDYMGGSLTNVTLTGNNVTATANASYVLELYGASGNTITNNVLNGTGHEESYGIHLSGASNNHITENTINTVGDTVTAITNGVYLEGSSDNALGSNTIHTTGAAADVDWSDWQNGGKYPTIGVFLFEGSNNNNLSGNTITTDYNPALISGTGWDTLLGVRIHKDSSTNSLINNNINTTGNSYAYGLEILGNNGNTSTNNTLSGNSINTVGNSVYANGVKVGGYTENTQVSGNTITATAPTFAYGIYLENYGGLVNATVDHNNVTTTANINYIIELYEADNCTITNNTLIGVGNYSMGIGTYSAANNTITHNTITTTGDNNASHPPNADSIPESNEGIKLHFNSDANTVEYNIIKSNDVYAVNSGHEASDSNIIRYNYLNSDNGNKMGDNAVTSGDDDTVMDNYGIPVANMRTGQIYTSIQGAINDSLTLDGDTIIVRSGIYNENITVSKQLTLNTTGSVTVQPVNVDLPVFTVDSTGSGSTITGFTITGATNSSGINLESAVNCNITDNNINGNSVGVKLYKSNSNIVAANTITGNIWAGICLDQATGNTINNTNIVSNNQEGIFLANNSNGNTIEGNNIHNNTGVGINVLSNSNSNTIQNNTASSNGVMGVFIQNSNTNTITTNIVQNNGWAGIVLDNATGNTINNLNVVSNNQEGIFLANNSNSNTIEGNNIHDNTGVGINVLSNSNSNTIQNNTASSNGVMGVFIQNSNTNTITTNTVQNNGWAGIVLDNATGNTINNLNVVSNNQEGIFLANNSNSNTIENNQTNSNTGNGITIIGSNTNTIKNNQLKDNTYSAIFIQNSTGTIIQHNTMESNLCGVVLDTTTSTTVYQNNFNGNIKQALASNGTGNTFYQGTTGNHWSDWIILPRPINGNENLYDQYPSTTPF